MKDIIDMEIVKQIESSGNPKAFNKASCCRGLYQISEVCFKDFRDCHPWQDWTLDDLYIPEVNTFIARWYMLIRLPAILRSQHIMPTTVNLLAAYNWGPGKAARWICNQDGDFNSLPEETRDYIAKYFEIEERDNA